MLIPVVVDQSDQAERSYDIYSRLLKERIVFAGEAINDDVANTIIAQLLYLESADPDKDINLYVNSPGGSVAAGLAIHDTLQYIKSDVCSTCMGQAFGSAALLLSAGAQGKRYALPHARIMIHQPLGGAEGTATEMELRAREIVRIKEVFRRLLAKHTGQSVEKIGQDMERDFFMDSEEAQKYGVIDKVITTRQNK
jgi:ATP-dependent Clp protease protease subunit